MIVKVRYNYKHFNLPPHATADRITVLDERKTTLPWLGFIDRRIARQIPDAKQVAIAVTGWATCECGKWEWVPENHFAVGCEIEEGVLAVTDRDRILTKQVRTSWA